MKTEFCCEAIKLLIDDPDCPLKYISYLRQYILTVPKYYLKKNELCMSFSITYCPRCGTKLPTDLVEQWHDIVEKQFGVSGIIDDNLMKLIPVEFKTNEWWKKRGL